MSKGKKYISSCFLESITLFLELLCIAQRSNKITEKNHSCAIIHAVIIILSGFMHFFITFASCFVNIYRFVQDRICFFIPVTFCKRHRSLVLSSSVCSSLPLCRCSSGQQDSQILPTPPVHLPPVNKTLSCEPFQCVLTPPKSCMLPALATPQDP